MNQLTNAESARLEGLIDKHTLVGVLEEIASICASKADHVNAHWQDAPLAKCWERAGNNVATCAKTRAVVVLP